MTSDRDPADRDPVDRARDDRDRADRDRDVAGRARNARPRDALGRPLPYGATGEDPVEEGVVRTPRETLDLAQALLDAGLPFSAHEVLEDAWKSAPETERELWRGLAQLAVGLTHALRGNARGAAALLERGAGSMAPYADAPLHDVDVAALLDWAGQASAAVAAGLAGELRPPALRG